MKSPEPMMDLLAKQWTMKMKATGAHYYHASNNKPWRIPSMVLLNGKVVNKCAACLTGPNGFVEIMLLNDRGDPLIRYDRFVTKTLHGHVVLVPGYFKCKPQQKRQNENG